MHGVKLAIGGRMKKPIPAEGNSLGCDHNVYVCSSYFALFFFLHKRESWDSGATGQLMFWQYTGGSSGMVNTVRHSYSPPSQFCFNSLNPVSAV